MARIWDPLPWPVTKEVSTELEDVRRMTLNVLAHAKIWLTVATGSSR